MSIIDRTLVFTLQDDNIIIDTKKNKNINNFIADLRNVDISIIQKIKDKFITFDHNISKKNGSFVVVCDVLFDDNLTIIPTLQEAYDYIEMEDMERKLNI